MPAVGEQQGTSIYDQAEHLRPRLVATCTGYETVVDHIEYKIIVEASGRMIGSARARYSAFLELHNEIARELELRPFPVGKALFHTSSLYASRAASLGKYIDDTLGHASASGKPIPTLLQAFLGLNQSSAVVAGDDDLQEEE